MVGYHQTNQKTDTGKTLTRRPVLVDHNRLPEGSRGRLAVAVAGAHPAAVQVTMTLVNDTGFDPVFSGSIAESWRQQPCTPSYCCDWEAATMLRAFLWRKREKDGPVCLHFMPASVSWVRHRLMKISLITIDPSTGLYNVAAGD